VIEQAKAHAMRVHEGQHDRDGRPHIEHVQRVADAVARADGDDPEAVMVAYLHDVIEDKAEESEQTLRAAGFPEPVTAAVTLLSRPNQGETYIGYVKVIAQAPGRPGQLARAVKLADLDDNIRRCQESGEASTERRYRQARRLIVG